MHEISIRLLEANTNAAVIFLLIVVAFFHVCSLQRFAAKNFFPGAEEVASSFDEFLVGAAEYVNQNPSSLPILTGEIGDTWVYGCASDPKKVTEMKRRNNS